MNGQYSAYWRETIIAALVLHAFIFAGIFFALTVSESEEKEASREFEWVDVEWVDTSTPIDLKLGSTEPDQAASTEEIYSQFGFMPLTIPELPPPDLPDWTAIDPPSPIESRPLPTTKPIDQEPQTQPSTPTQMPWGSAPLGSNESSVERIEKPVEEVSTGERRMAEPPVVIEEHYPPKSGAFHFDGAVSILVRIGEDGSVKRTRVMYSSGRMLVDGAAVSAALKWKFTPALDQNGQPMECDKILMFDFKDFQ